MFWILFLVFFFFRRRILTPVIGPIRMWLFDAIMWTFLAATCFANPGPWMWFSYGAGCLDILFAIQAGRTYLKCDEIQGKENGKGKPNSGPTAGS